MSRRLTLLSSGMLLALGGCGLPEGEEIERTQRRLEEAPNWAGVSASAHTSGAIDRTNPFFQQLGSNQRTCEACHSSAQGWTIAAKPTRELFDATLGLAPLFMLHDAGNRPDADLSTFEARKDAFKKTLLDRGVTRFTRNINPAAEFAVTAVYDPYGWSDTTRLSAFRRPTPTVNESKVVATGWNNGPHDVATAVASTAVGASRLHLQRVDTLPAELAAAMRDFQMGLVVAQSVDNVAGALDADGARGGPDHLMAQPFYVGINDLTGGDPTGRPFSRKVFDLFDAWEVYTQSAAPNEQAAARAAIYRGQELFNNYEFDIAGVTGINDLFGQPVVRGTCSTCHNVPNVGGHAVFRMFDIGTADVARCDSSMLLITLQNKATGEVRQVCDLGRGQTSGRWVDVGAFRAPPLRALAARAPYFHDGQAADIKEVIKYYDHRFGMQLTDGAKHDLEAFLRAL